jgi:hypothetical protein
VVLATFPVTPLTALPTVSVTLPKLLPRPPRVFDKSNAPADVEAMAKNNEVDATTVRKLCFATIFSFVDVNQFIEGLPPKKPVNTDARKAT